MTRLAAAAACAAIALLTFVQFPGHTWLQQDTQIYAAIIQHERDPAALRNDIVAQHPHVAYTLYDDAALVLSHFTGGDLRIALEGQQLIARFLGVLGLFLMASAIGLTDSLALTVAAIVSLGATIAGPAVLTIEYEPTPRAVAVPLLICAIGLASQRRFGWAAIATSVAILYHAPTTWPVLLVLIPMLFVRKQWRELALIAGSIAILFAKSAGQREQSLFATLDPLDIQLQRMRTAYNWISQWHAAWIVHWFLVATIAALALYRIRAKIPAELRAFSAALPVLALLSMPLSWLLLEQFHWAIVPQAQPMRALLFPALLLQFLAAAAAFLAPRWLESAAWFAAATALPTQPILTEAWQWRHVLAIAVTALLATALLRRAPQFTPIAALAAFFTIPMIAGVVNYPRLHTPALAALSGWAREHTARDAVFAFPDAGHLVYPGIFRAEAERAVYVDWKGGGQVNFSHAFAEEWWLRWNLQQKPAPTLAVFGVDYVVLHTMRLSTQPEFTNGEYAVYRLHQ